MGRCSGNGRGRGARAALLVIDLQRYFLVRGERAFLPGAPAIIPRVLKLVEAFRRAGLPIVFTRHAHRPGTPTGQMGRWWKGKLPREGEPHSELVDAIAPRRGEALITKTRYSAFEGTSLAGRLRRRGARAVVLCGVMTNLCVETTARHAFMKDFEVTVARDACAANTRAHHLASLKNLAYGFAHALSTGEIIRRLGR